MNSTSVAPLGKILVIEDEKHLRTNLQLVLADEGYTVDIAADGQAGIEALHHDKFDLILTDIMMGEISGLQVMEYAATRAPETLVIVMTGYASIESAIDALRKGAYDYITKPFEIEMITTAVGRAMERLRLRRTVQHHTREIEATNLKLQRSLDELQVAQKRLLQTEKLAALGTLVADLAHTLHGPLSKILENGEALLASPDTPPEIRFVLTKSHHEALECQHIVHNLLSFARKQKLQKSYLNVNTICRQAVDFLAYQCKTHNVKTIMHLDETVPCTMLDAPQFQQVLVHVMSNAVQAIAEYQGSGQLTISTACDPAYLYVKVTDTGPGIAPEHLSHIFDPFYTTRRHNVGLGLSLSYGLMQEHSGHITVTSQPGEGTTVTLALPLCQDTISREDAPASLTHMAPPAKQALVIDAVRSMAQTTVTLLRALGYQVEAVYSGRDALQKIGQQEYDLILCDLHLPGADGQQLYQFLQNSPPGDMARFIFTHDKTNSEEPPRFEHESMPAVLHKPFLLKEFKQAVHLLDKRG